MQDACQYGVALGDRHQQEGAHRRPDLHAHTVGMGAVETAQAQVLFDPAKERFDFQAVFVDQRDGQRINTAKNPVFFKDQNTGSHPGLIAGEAEPANLLFT